VPATTSIQKLVLAALFVFALGLAQSAGAQPLLPVNINGQFGYINTDGRVVIEPQFDSAGDFVDGLAPVGKKAGRDNRFGYINEKGAITIPMKFQDVREFSEGRAVVKFLGRYGVIDTSGKFVAEPVFDRAFSFSDGAARVIQQDMHTGESRYGFIDRQGKLIITPQYVFASDFREGLAGFAVSGNDTLKMGFIDKLNRVVIKPKFNVVGSFSEGLAPVAQDAVTYLFEGSVLIAEASSPRKKIMYVDKRGSVVITGEFDSANDFSEGLAVVEIDARCRYIDKTGKVMLQPNFPAKADCGKFSEGMAPINHDNGAKFIDKNGKTVITTTFDWADRFRAGVARVTVVTRAGLFTYGYIDRTGRVIWKP